MTVYRNVEEIDAEGFDFNQHVKLNQPYEVGLLGVPALNRAIDEAVIKGVIVDNESLGGGFFVRRGRLRIEGRWGDARALLLTLEWLAEEE